MKGSYKYIKNDFSLVIRKLNRVKMDLPIYKVKKTISNYPTNKVSEENLFEFEIFLFNDFPKFAKKEDLELFTTGEINGHRVKQNLLSLLKINIGKIKRSKSFSSEKHYRKKLKRKHSKGTHSN